MKNLRQQLAYFLCLYAAFTISIGSASAQSVEGVEIRKIWDSAEHSAFTDLLYFKGNFYCSFREGSGHIPGTDGTVRILKSKDGKKWENLAELKKAGLDLRDPKLSITPEGRIMVIIGGSIYNKGKLEGRQPHVSFSDKSGKVFSAPEPASIDPSIVSWGDWLWRVTWHNGVGYTIDYQIGPEERRGPTAMYLLRTKDGKTYEKVSKIDLDGFPNEATVRFDKSGKMHVMIRRETLDQNGVWAVSSAPFTQWEYNKMNLRLGGPNFVFTDKGKIVAGTRVYKGNTYYTGLYTGTPSGEFREVVAFPGSGDTSYPGLVIHKGKLWVSYYSSHEGKSAIYIAEIPMKNLDAHL
jgi:hypothetical protein